MTHNDKLISIINAVNEYAEHLRNHDAGDIATKLKEITGGEPKKWDDEDLTQLVRMGTAAYDRELSARGSQPRVIGVITATLDWLNEYENCTWTAVELERLANEIETKYK